MRSIKRTALLAALVVAAGPAAAQGIQSPIRYVEQAQGISAFTGWVFSNPNITVNDSTGQRVEMGPQAAPIFGVQYQIRASGPLSLRLSTGYIASKRKVFLAEAVNDSTEIRAIDTGREVNLGILLVEGGFLFHLTGPRTYHGIAPFTGITVGMARRIRGGDPQDSTIAAPERYHFGPAFAVAADLGTDVFLTRTFSLRLELNGRLLRESAPAGFRSVIQRKQGEWNNASSAQVGAVLHF
jgi:hypothetical protein